MRSAARPIPAPPVRPTLLAALAVALLALGLPGSAAVGQEPEPREEEAEQEEPPRPAEEVEPEGPEGPDEPGLRRCVLTWEPASPETRSVSVRDPAGGHVTHVGGGMEWTCGTAVMEADSAVRYEAERRVELLGRVRYRDTIRRLDSERLDYYQVGDRVVATGDVRLERFGSGSTLEGPRVEFLRAVSGVAERTVATGRPHMVLRSEEDPEAPPFEVDADRTEFAGEERAAAWGEVVIERPDLRASSDSAFFDLEAGTGLLLGTPRAAGERFSLEGDTIRLRFQEGDLEEVRALGRGRAAGESFEVLAEAIHIRVEEDEVDAVWAFGPERSLALSPPHRLYGDSLRFFLVEGRLDTIVAVGRAVAVRGEETTERAAEDEPTARSGAGAEPRRIPDPELPVERETNWATGDTLWAMFEPLPAEPAEDGADEAAEQGDGADGAAEDGDEPDGAAERETATEPAGDREARLRRIRVVGDARAFYAAVRDTTRTSIPSRNYLIGREIEILFEEGEASRVVGRDAIGLYLDPLEEGAAGEAPPGRAPPDTLPPLPQGEPAPSDTVSGPAERPPEGGR